jgi:hypothetical protein
LDNPQTNIIKITPISVQNIGLVSNLSKVYIPYICILSASILSASIKPNNNAGLENLNFLANIPITEQTMSIT